MKPFFFGPPQRKLFAAYHQAEIAKKRADGLAVLVCNPFGQEYVRSHRMLRTLADRLARRGASCLRFDYYGTGDSAGEDEDSAISGWEEDILAAHQELVRRSSSGRVLWLGVRLGAVAALRAANRTKELAGLVLWEPIGSGHAYLAYLEACNRHALAASYTLAPPDTLVDLEREILGFALGDTMRRELEAVGPASTAGLPPIVCVMPPRTGSALAAPAGTKTTTLAHELEWNSEEALNHALVPAAAVRFLCEQIEVFA